MAGPLLTLGTEKRTLDKFLGLLDPHRVRLVVDVRQDPFSRNSGFTKKHLAAALRAAGVGYLHLGALGCPKPLRDAYHAGGPRAAYLAGYQAHLAAQADALEHLRRLVTQGGLAVLCMERRIEACHRQALAEDLAAHGLHVTNL